MAGGINLGLNGQLYVAASTGAYYTTGTKVDNCQDLTLKVEKNTTEVTTRGNNGWRAKLGVLRDATVTFKMNWDNADPAMLIIMNSFLANVAPANQIEGAILDKDGKGLEATFGVTSFTRNEPLEEAMSVDVELTIGYNPTHPPTWIT